MIESPTITTINVASAIIAIVGGAMAIYLFFRNRQFGGPKLRLILGWGSSSAIPKRLRNKPFGLFVIAPVSPLRKPLLTTLGFALRNSGTEAVRNVRIVFEYHKRHVIRNDTFVSLAKYEPTIVADLSDSKTATVISSSLTPEDIAKILQERQVTVVRDTAQVSMEIGVIRPGETAFVYDLLSLDGFSNSPQKITGSDDVNHVLKLLSDIQSLLDHAVVNAFVFAENHTKLKNRISVLRFISEKDLEEGLRRFVEAQWLGEFPKSGLYFADPIYRLLRRKVWHTGSTKDRRVFREDVGLIRFSKVAEIKTEDGLIVKELPEYSEEQYFALEVPNYDYLELPSKVNNSEALKEWLGLAKKPLLKR